MASLLNAKVGDKLRVLSRYGWHVEVVTKILKLHIVTDKTNKFRKSDGNFVGGSDWCSKYAVLTTDEEIAEIRAKERARIEFNDLVSKCSHTEYKKLSADKLKKILEIINS